MIPIKFGAADNIVAILYLDLESLTFLANEGRDGFFRECVAMLEWCSKQADAEE